MPKPRVIDGSFWNDLDMAELTRDERLLVAGMITKCADDYGRLVAHPKHLRREVFGYDEDLSVEDVALMREHIIERCRNVVLYTDNAQEYIYFPNWQKWQKIRYQIDSKLPPPPGIVPESDTPLQEIPANSGKFPLCSVEQGRAGLGRVEQGRVEQGSVVAANSPLQALLDIGMNPDTAQKLVNECEDWAILGWCDELAKRVRAGKQIDNPAGWVRGMLKRGIPPPAVHDNELTNMSGT